MPKRADATTDYYFTVGDIEGEADLLDALLEKIEKYPLIALNDTIIFTGNYVGFGKKSKDVLSRLQALKRTSRNTIACVRGCEDHRFLRMKPAFLTSEISTPIINSYRLLANERYPKDSHKLDVKEMSRHRDWLNTKHTFYITDRILFCNAGISTKTPIANHPAATFMFNTDQEQFLKSGIKWPYLIVHGHYRESDAGLIKVKHNRINVNTSPSKTGKLSCAVINGKTLKVEDIITVSKN